LIAFTNSRFLTFDGLSFLERERQADAERRSAGLIRQADKAVVAAFDDLDARFQELLDWWENQCLDAVEQADRCPAYTPTRQVYASLRAYLDERAQQAHRPPGQPARVPGPRARRLRQRHLGAGRRPRRVAGSERVPMTALRDAVARVFGEHAAALMEMSPQERAKLDAQNELLLPELDADAEQDAYMRQWDYQSVDGS
jgi:hypothetical protein